MDITKPSKFMMALLKLESKIKTKRYSSFCGKLGLKGNEKVLEFGCGWGGNTAELVKRLPGGSLLCIDLSKAWIDFTKKRLAGNYPNADFISGDIRKIASQAETMDAIVIHHVLHDIPPAERLSTMQALKRWLKPEGKVFIQEPSKAGHGMSLESIRQIMSQSGLEMVEKQEAARFTFSAYSRLA